MMKKNKLIFLIKIVVSVSLLTFILIKVEWNKVFENLSHANLILLFAAILLNIFERFELTYKWNLLIKVRGIVVEFRRLFWINSIGSFLGLFLPSSVGTDVVRGYYLVKNNSEKSVSISSVFVDRVLGMFSLIIVGTVAVFFAGDLIAAYNLKFYLLALLIAVTILFYLFQRNESVKLLDRIFQKVKHKKFIEQGIKLHSSILEYKKYPKTLIISFIITLLVQVTRVLTYYFVALCFGIQISIVYFFLFIPIIMIVIMLPISIGGLGLREGTFIAFFTLVGMTMDDAATIIFINSLLDTFNTLVLGGGGYLFYKSPLKADEILENENNLVKSK